MRSTQQLLRPLVTQSTKDRRLFIKLTSIKLVVSQRSDSDAFWPLSVWLCRFYLLLSIIAFFTLGWTVRLSLLESLYDCLFVWLLSVCVRVCLIVCLFLVCLFIYLYDWDWYIFGLLIFIIKRWTIHRLFFSQLVDTFFWCRVSNRGSLVLEETALPTESQPLPQVYLSF